MARLLTELSGTGHLPRWLEEHVAAFDPAHVRPRGRHRAAASAPAHAAPARRGAGPRGLRRQQRVRPRGGAVPRRASSSRFRSPRKTWPTWWCTRPTGSTARPSASSTCSSRAPSSRAGWPIGAGDRARRATELSGAGPLQAAPLRARRRGDPRVEVSHDARDRRRRARAPGEPRRSARHAPRRFPPANVARRAAAVHQRADRRHVRRRAATARRRAQRAVPDADPRVHAASQGQAGDHRLGAGQRVARRDRHAREDDRARGPRHRVHPPLQLLLRPEDHLPHGLRATSPSHNAY